MKLDKIKFAAVVGYIYSLLPEKHPDIEELDRLIDVDVPEAPEVYPSIADINELMRLMAEGTHKIEAIKIHRKLTGYGLKDSKDEVEKHWAMRRSKQELYAKLNEWAKEKQLTPEQDNAIATFINWSF